MKVIIAGSRDWSPSLEEIDSAIAELLNATEDLFSPRARVTEVVSGRARGADAAGETWAERMGLPVAPFPADWKLYGDAAGAIRNTAMADYAEAAVVFQRSLSSGSQDMIDKMNRRGKRCIVRRCT